MANDLKGKKNLLIYAAIAFVVVIILIIAFFPGPKKEAEHGPQVISKRVKLNLIDETVNVDANGPAQDADKTASAEATAHDAAKAEPVEKPAPVKKAVVKKAVVKKARPAPKKVQTASVDRSTLARRKPWAVNVASFPNLDGARRLKRSLDAAGYNAYITRFSKDGVNWARVRVGFYASKEEARRSGDAVKRQYKVQSPWIVKPTREETSSHIR